MIKLTKKNIGKYYLLAAGTKCPRCWKHSLTPNAEGLCPRCAEVVRHLPDLL